MIHSAFMGYRFVVASEIGGPQRVINVAGVKLFTAMNCRLSRGSLTHFGAPINTRTPTNPRMHPAAMSSLLFITCLPEGRCNHHHLRGPALDRFFRMVPPHSHWPLEQGAARCVIIRVPFFLYGRNAPGA